MFCGTATRVTVRCLTKEMPFPLPSIILILSIFPFSSIAHTFGFPISLLIDFQCEFPAGHATYMHKRQSIMASELRVRKGGISVEMRAQATVSTPHSPHRAMGNRTALLLSALICALLFIDHPLAIHLGGAGGGSNADGNRVSGTGKAEKALWRHLSIPPMHHPPLPTSAVVPSPRPCRRRLCKGQSTTNSTTQPEPQPPGQPKE